MKVAVIGAGSWGTALATLLERNGHDVILIGREPDEIAAMRRDRVNARYLPGIKLGDNLAFGLIGDAPSAADFWIVATPSGGVLETVRAIPQANPFIVLASKGLDSASCELLSEVVARARPDALIGAISGPNLAIEVINGIPTATLAACSDPNQAAMICEAVRSPSFRAYYTDDLIGVELAGALKNVLAIGAGMSDGLGFGDNTKGALLARGLREMVRLGLSKGAQLETFFGIAGVGDLFATASSKLSRNYRVGYGLGKGQDIAEILAEIGQVAEGVNTAACVETLAKRSNLELPIMHMIHGVIMGQVSSRDAVVALMEREPKREALF